jgi:hypothetical protein
MNEEKHFICQNCQWFKDIEKSEAVGKCHRFPPTVLTKNDEIEYEFPSVLGDDYCAEFLDFSEHHPSCE